MTPKIVSRAHVGVLLSHGALLAVVLAWQLGANPFPAGLWRGLVAAIPLLAPLPGLLRSHRMTHVWSTLCVTPYLIIGVMEAVANPGERLWPGLCVLLALVFFASLILYLRVTNPARSA